MHLCLARANLTASSEFSTSFPATENPLSLGGRATNGGDTGLDWQNCRSTPGLCFGTGSSPATTNDNEFTIQNSGFSTSKHFVEVTINIFSGYIPPDSHEVEVTSFAITANSIKGYEMDFGFGTNIQPVRWNGPLNSFDTAVFTTVSGTGFSVVHGDVIKVIFDYTGASPVLTVFRNAVQEIVFTDTTAGKILTGNPGAGFFARPGAGLDLSKYSISTFRCGNA